MSICKNSVLQAHSTVHIVDEVQIFIVYVSYFRCLGYCAKLQCSSPVAPHHAVFNVKVFCYLIFPLLTSVGNYNIIKISEEGIFNRHILTVDKVNSVCVVSPHSDVSYIVYFDVFTVVKGLCPAGRILECYSVNHYVFTFVNSHCTDCKVSVFIGSRLCLCSSYLL